MLLICIILSLFLNIWVVCKNGVTLFFFLMRRIFAVQIFFSLSSVFRVIGFLEVFHVDFICN